MDALKQAVEEASRSDLMLVLGTSLTVYPAASMPQYTLANNGEIIIVNNEPTPMHDRAVLHFDDLGTVFEMLDEKLKSSN